MPSSVPIVNNDNGMSITNTNNNNIVTLVIPSIAGYF